jgi:hypothetical protein
MSEITIKRGDNKVIFRDTPTINGVAMTSADLTGCTLKFLMRGIRNISQPATITGSATFEYQPTATDVGVSGIFKQEWELTFPDTKRLTFPSDGYNTVTILDDLG